MQGLGCKVARTMLRTGSMICGPVLWCVYAPSWTKSMNPCIFIAFLELFFYGKTAKIEHDVSDEISKLIRGNLNTDECLLARRRC